MQVPRDQEDSRFVQSFSIEQEDEFTTFFDQYGFMVIHNILSQNDIDQTVNDIWNTILTSPANEPILEDEESQKSIDKNDPDTWTTENGWPSEAHTGLLGHNVAIEPSAFENRQNPYIHKAFSKLIGSRELLVSIDRFGVMRPTVQVLQKDGISHKDYPEYVTQEKWLHWDMNPWKLLPKNATQLELEDYEIDIRDIFGGFFISENNETLLPYKKLQGLVALTDCTEEDGGFLCVPGFQNEITKWSEENEDLYERKRHKNFISVPPNDPIMNQVTKIPIKAGSLLIWDSRLPHCNYPNHSDKFRMVQYIKMFPIVNKGENFLQSRRNLVQKLLDMAHFEPSHLGKQLLGIESYQ